MKNENFAVGQLIIYLNVKRPYLKISRERLRYEADLQFLVVPLVSRSLWALVYAILAHSVTESRNFI